MAGAGVNPLQKDFAHAYLEKEGTRKAAKG
jgi:hypothetical protein